MKPKKKLDGNLSMEMYFRPPSNVGTFFGDDTRYNDIFHAWASFTIQSWWTDDNYGSLMGLHGFVCWLLFCSFVYGYPAILLDHYKIRWQLIPIEKLLPKFHSL